MQHTNVLKMGEVFDQRMKIRRQVTKALGIVLPRDIDAEVREEIRQSIINCVTCRNTEPCLEWLKAGEVEAGPPENCPNREIFQILKCRGAG